MATEDQDELDTLIAERNAITERLLQFRATRYPGLASNLPTPVVSGDPEANQLIADLEAQAKREVAFLNRINGAGE